MFGEKEETYANCFINIKDFGDGSLKKPSTHFFNYITYLEKEFKKLFVDYSTKPGIGVNIFKILYGLEHTFLKLCPDFPKEFCLKLFVRLRIYYSLKFYNNEIKNSSKHKNKIKILKHL